MKVQPFQHCCKRATIQAFQKRTFYLIGCDDCGTCFSITDDLQLFIQQLIAFHQISPSHPHPFDLALYKGKVIFMLP